MTAKRDLKRLVRDRQEQTGESYMTALRHVRAQRPSAISVVELVDLTEIGAPLGYKCRIRITPDLTGRIDVSAALIQFRDLLLATGRDRDLDLMRDVALRGDRPSVRHAPTPIVDLRQFFARARGGLGGVSWSGRLVAMSVGGAGRAQMIVFMLSLMPPGFPISREPSLALSDIPELDESTGWQVIPW